VVRGLTDLQ